MKKYQNNIQTIEYQEDKKLLTQVWTKESKRISEKEFQAEMLELARFFHYTQPTRVLIDMRDFYFVVSLELQTWVNENVNSKLASMNTRTAFVVSPDLFTAISVEQTLDEKSGAKMSRNFFEDIQLAKDWLR